jgi:hypothetical protein
MPREQATADVAGMVKANMQTLTAIQKELGDTIEEANRHWLARAKSEAELASDLMAKLAHTQSIPDATAYTRNGWGIECSGSPKTVKNALPTVKNWRARGLDWPPTKT